MPKNDEHWQKVYREKEAADVSWYRPHLEQSLTFIREASLPADARIADIGGGASTLVDDLLAEGFHNVAVIDLAKAGLDAARTRLGDRGDGVDWIVGDAAAPHFPEASVDFWHDRAVFHFLTEEDARAAYVEQVTRSVKPGGHVLVATFALDGPEKCSGLPVARYDAAGIHRVFGDAFEKIGEAREEHKTPWGSVQSFAYCLCQKL